MPRIRQRVPRLRSRPEDFCVEEIRRAPPGSEAGNHTQLLIEKRLRNTGEVVREIASGLGIEPRRVGYAGRKDRVAVARQWLSVPNAVAGRVDGLAIDGVRILDAVADEPSLSLGHLAGNRFRIRLREVDAELAEVAGTAFEKLAVSGMGNRFGAQRYGRDEANVERGRQLLARGRFGRDRRAGRLMLSALQAQVFDAVLERRRPALGELLRGDVAFVHRTGELLWVDEPARYSARAAAFEVSPTGPLFGHKAKRPRGSVAQLERETLEEHGLADLDHAVLRRLRLYGDRRALRVQPRDLSWLYADDVLELRFELPPGSYATVLVEELFPEGVEEGGDASS